LYDELPKPLKSGAYIKLSAKTGYNLSIKLFILQIFDESIVEWRRITHLLDKGLFGKISRYAQISPFFKGSSLSKENED